MTSPVPVVPEACVSLGSAPQSEGAYSLSRRVWNAAVGLCYGGAFIVGYYLFLNEYFSYAGFALVNDLRVWFLVLALVIATAPLLLYSGMRAISSLFAIFIYLFIYTPTTLTLALALEGSTMTTLLIQLTFASGMSMIFLADRALPWKTVSLGVNANLLPWIAAISLFMTAVIGYVYRGNLSLVGFADVYDLRLANNEVGQGLVVRYGTSWLANFMIPVCLAHGLLRRNWFYFLVGAAGCLTIYMATAAKSVVLFPVIFFGLYLLLRKGRIQRSYELLALSLTAIMLISLCFEFNIASSLLWMRSIGNGGVMTLHYLNFFSDHPYTFYTHIKLVAAITGYSPYAGQQIGVAVGRFFMSEETSANAHFWATDGIGACGLPGVLIISVVLFGALVCANLVTRRHDKMFVLLTFLPFLVTLLNMSLFTAVWSGGALFLALFFAVTPTIEASRGDVGGRRGGSRRRVGRPVEFS
jgi:hypothetical protein